MAGYQQLQEVFCILLFWKKENLTETILMNLQNKQRNYPDELAKASKQAGKQANKNSAIRI